jgi:transcriptional antiterminator RfaH
MIPSQVANQRGGFSWYAVVTHAGKERLAKFHLGRQGFETYLPMRAPLTRGLAAKPAQPRPMFPRHLFVSVDLNAPGWRSIYSTIGVSSVLTTGSGEASRPRAVPNFVIEALQAREINGLVVLDRPEVAAAVCPHKKGDTVRIGMGRYADMDAIFEERVDNARVSLLVQLLGREHRVVTHLAHLK